MITTEIALRWRDAPCVEVGMDGRWVRFAAPGRSVYLECYAWDEQTRPHYLVVAPEDDGADQVRYTTLDEALWAVRVLCGREG